MANDLTLHQTKEMDNYKQPATLDEALEAKMAPVIGAVNQHVEKIYQDFNMALYRQMQGMDKVEKDLSHMVQVLWGLVNESNARLAAIETVLVRNGMDPEDLATELANIKEQLKAAGMEEVPLMQEMSTVEAPLGSPDLAPPL